MREKGRKKMAERGRTSRRRKKTASVRAAQTRKARDRRTSSTAGRRRVAHFEIIAKDAVRSRAFYEKVLGWKFVEPKVEESPSLPKSVPADQAPAYLGVDTGTDVTGVLAQQPSDALRPMINLFFQVDDLDATLGGAAREGGKVTFGRFKVPGVGFLGMFADPDGLEIGVMELESRKILAIKRALRAGLRAFGGGASWSSDAVALAMMSRDEAGICRTSWPNLVR